MQSQSNFAELERRINAALGRIDAGMAGMVQGGDALRAALKTAQEEKIQAQAEVARLSAALLAAELSANEAEFAEEPLALGAAPEAVSVAVENDAIVAELRADVAAKEAELSVLREALEREQALSERLQDQLTALRSEPVHTGPAALVAKYERLSAQHDVQGLDVQRLRKSLHQMRQQIQQMQEASLAGALDGAMINKAMLAELEALRVTRESEIAEMDAILAELGPMIEEARNHG